MYSRTLGKGFSYICSPQLHLICFRVVESVFEKLVNWAAAALEKSSNQPVLPHAIIVLNASENDIDPNLWDVEASTESLLESLSRTVYHNATFKKYAQFWRERSRPVETVKQLMESYYSSIKVSQIIPLHQGYRTPLQGISYVRALSNRIIDYTHTCAGTAKTDRAASRKTLQRHPYCLHNCQREKN